MSDPGIPKLDAPLTPDQLAWLAAHERDLDDRARAESRRAATVAQSLAVSRAIRACPHRGEPSCGCEGMARCAAGKGRGGDVSHSDCWACRLDEILPRG
jgi:hypothetical protein